MRISKSNALSFFVAAAILWSASSAATAQTQSDVVVRQLPQGAGRTVVHGTIVDYTGRELTIRLDTGQRVQSIPAREVIDVQTQQTQSHLDGLKAIAENRLGDAEQSLNAALSDETRTWVRREILALLVRCALARKNHADAGSRFLALVQSDPTTPQFKVIPLSWAAGPTDSVPTNQARAWMERGNDVARLLGASALLTDPREQPAARQTLEELSSNPDVRIQRLAQAQLWRLRLASGKLDPTELARWEDFIERMPPELRGGPYFVLGQGYLQLRENDRAARALLWLPLNYEHDRWLSAQSLFDAAGALAGIGQQAEAIALYREITLRFGETSYARDAQARIDAANSPAQQTNNAAPQVDSPQAE